MSDIEANKAVLNREGSMLLKPDLAEAIVSPRKNAAELGASLRELT